MSAAETSAVTPAIPAGLVTIEVMIETLWPNPKCRPTPRHIRDLCNEAKVPFVRLGRSVYFEPAHVRAALDAQKTAQYGRKS